ASRYLRLEGRCDTGIADRQQGLEVSLVAVDDQLAGRQRVEGGCHAVSSTNRARSMPAIRASASTRSMLVMSGACRARSVQRSRQARSKDRQASLSRAAMRATSVSDADMAGSASHPP